MCACGGVPDRAIGYCADKTGIVIKGICDDNQVGDGVFRLVGDGYNVGESLSIGDRIQRVCLCDGEIRFGRDEIFNLQKRNGLVACGNGVGQGCFGGDQSGLNVAGSGEWHLVLKDEPDLDDDMVAVIKSFQVECSYDFIGSCRICVVLQLP